VVVPMYNAEETVGAQLEAILGQQWPAEWELVVADNGSTDASPSIVRTAADRDRRVRLIDASDAKGPAHARNTGVAHARGRSIAFCDADDVVAPGWLAATGEALRRSPATTGPQELCALNPPWLRGAYGGRSSDRAQSFIDVFPFGPSANLGVQRDVFVKLGGFDAEVQVGEDIEFCLRLWVDGQHLEFVPGAVVHYRNRASLRGLWAQARAYGAVAPMIAARLERIGHPVPARLAGVRNWFWLVRRAPTLRTKEGRARWLVVAGGVVGRIVGSLRHRTLYL
jgi:glycosyltransferase involved in cell wall biosynthesis